MTELEEAGDLQEEIGMMRVVTRRLLDAARECNDMGALINLLNTLGLASTRVAGLMKTQKFLGGGEDGIEEFLNSLVDEETKDWPIKKGIGRKITWEQISRHNMGWIKRMGTLIMTV